MRPEKLVLKPEKLVLKKPTVEDLDRILNGEGQYQFVPGPGGELIEVVRLTDLRANIGGWMDNVAAGRKLAVARKGTVLAFLLPPVGKPRPTMSQLEKLLEIEEVYD